MRNVPRLHRACPKCGVVYQATHLPFVGGYGSGGDLRKCPACHHEAGTKQFTIVKDNGESVKPWRDAADTINATGQLTNVRRVMAFVAERPCPDGRAQPVTLEITDAGASTPAPSERFQATARTKDGRSVTGEAAPSIATAVERLPWDRLDAVREEAGATV